MVGGAEAQRAEAERLQALLLELSATVTTHPYGATVDKEVEARTALEHAHETPTTARPPSHRLRAPAGQAVPGDGLPGVVWA